MSRIDVVDPQVDVDLLRVPMRPIGRNVIRCQPDSDARFTIDDHHVPALVSVDRPIQESGPKGALGGQVIYVENDHLMLDLR